ncbi:hypothetical protein JCM8097_008132 [Rhodosporidiobolus ruineniae]
MSAQTATRIPHQQPRSPCKPPSSSFNLISSTLSSLPNDLKARIAHEVKLVDTSYGEPFDVFEGEQLKVDFGVGGRSTTSLRRLSRVSKEWHKLCTPLVWGDLTLSTFDVDKLDRVRLLLPRFGRHVKYFRSQSDEYSGSPVKAPQLAELVQSFPNLESLSLSFNKMKEVPSFTQPLPVKRLRIFVREGFKPEYASFFDSFSATLETLILELFNPAETPAFDLPKLTHLAIEPLVGGYRTTLPPFRFAPLSHLYLGECGEQYLRDLLGDLKEHSSTLRTFRAPYKLYTDSDEARHALDAMRSWGDEKGIAVMVPTLIREDEALEGFNADAWQENYMKEHWWEVK